MANNFNDTVELSEEYVLEAAQQETGLSDFGSEHFRVSLPKLLESFDREANLHITGRKSIQKHIVRLLVNRLQIQQDFKRYPEILQVSIKRPLFIIGLPRSGSTYLQNLLSQDPSCRWPRMWELFTPSPSPDPKTKTTDPRIKKAEQFLEKWETVIDIKSMHEIDANRPEECRYLFEHDFMFPSFTMLGHIPSYMEWLKKQDLTPTYQYYYQQIQLLGWKWSGDRWLFKSARHHAYLSTLMATFPDGCFVQTHRNPLSIIPSMSRLKMKVRSGYSEQVNTKNIAKETLDTLSQSTEKLLEAREATDNSDKIFDVQYNNLIEDSIGTVRQIYDHFGYELSWEMETNLREYISNNPQYKYGKYTYSLEEFGLDAKTIEQKFGEYIQKFIIP